MDLIIWSTFTHTHKVYLFLVVKEGMNCILYTILVTNKIFVLALCFCVSVTPVVPNPPVIKVKTGTSGGELELECEARTILANDVEYEFEWVVDEKVQQRNSIQFSSMRKEVSATLKWDYFMQGVNIQGGVSRSFLSCFR